MINAPQREQLRLSGDEMRMLKKLKQWRDDFPTMARERLHVVDKESRLRRMVLNKAQMIIHAKAEQQKLDHGMVRALILKGRKQGSSTYVGARFYGQTQLYKYKTAKVMAHHQDSTDALFDMVKTFYENDPARLGSDTSNAKQYVFENNSSYEVATAGGSGEAGRGDTPTLAHMSEVAFYKNAEKNFAGFANSIPLSPGTEIFAESTANGLGNEFHRRWMRAEAGLEDEASGISYIPIFIPWYLSDEYRLPVPQGFQLRNDPEGDGLPTEAEIAEMYGLDMGQMAWRRFQLDEALGSVELFMQEYPCTANEAFQTTGVDLFIKPVWVMKARKRKDIEPYGPLILGVDPAGPGSGADKFAMTIRQGNVILKTIGRMGVDPQEAIHWVAGVIREYSIDRANIDNGGGWGASLLSGIRTHYPDLADKCFPVDFGGRSQWKSVNPQKPGPRNRRAEMYQRMQKWFMMPEGVSIPDDDTLMSDLGAVTANSNGQSTDLLIAPKTEIKKTLGRSPDDADSAALTFAFPDNNIPRTLTPSKPGGNEQFEGGQASRPSTTQEAPAVVDDYTPFNGGFGGFDSGGGWMV